MSKMSAERTMPQRGTISRSRELLSVISGVQPVRNRPEAPSFPRSPFDTLVSRAPSERPASQKEARQPAVRPQQTIDQVRQELSQDTSVPTESEPGVTTVSGGVLGEQHRPRSMNRNGILTPVKWDTYTVDKPDGTQEVYLERPTARPLQIVGRMHPQERGVWKEVWSAPEGRSHKRKLLSGPERVGETSIVIKKELPNGTEVDNIQILSTEFMKKQQEAAKERGERIQKVLPTVEYAATEVDRLFQEAQKDRLRAILKTTKETTGQQIAKTIPLVAVNGLSSVIFWVPNLLSGPNALIARFPLAMGISYLGNTLFNRSFMTDNTIAKANIVLGAAAAGFGIGVLTPVPFGGFIGAAIGVAGAAGNILWERAKQLKRIAKEHPEVTNKAELRQMRKEENYAAVEEAGVKKRVQMEHRQLRVRMQQFQRFGIIPQYSQEFFQENQELARRIIARVPDITLPELGLAIDQMHLQSRSNDIAGYYLSKATKGFNARLFGSLGLAASVYLSQVIPGIGEVTRNIITTAPLAISGAFTTWNAVISPFILHRKVKAVREEMREKNPELLRELLNGKK